MTAFQNMSCHVIIKMTILVGIKSYEVLFYYISSFGGIFVHSDDPCRLFQSAREHIYAADQLLWSNYSCAADTLGEFG
jgi:hypothetical protein